MLFKESSTYLKHNKYLLSVIFKRYFICYEIRSRSKTFIIVLVVFRIVFWSLKIFKGILSLPLLERTRALRFRIIKSFIFLSKVIPFNVRLICLHFCFIHHPWHLLFLSLVGFHENIYRHYASTEKKMYTLYAPMIRKARGITIQRTNVWDNTGRNIPQITQQT